MSGPASPRIVVFGDSHIHAIQQAHRRRASEGRDLPLQAMRLTRIKNSKPIGDKSFDEILEIANELGPEDVVVSAAGGNQHAIFSTIQHPEPFDFVMPGEAAVDLTGAATIVPYRTIYEAFAEPIRKGFEKSFRMLRKRTGARIACLMAPPPKRDNAFIEQYHDTRFANEGISSFGVSPPELRMKFWRLQIRVLEELCAQLGVDALMPPEGTRDEHGFLAPPFYANDATHANARYGELVVQQLVERYKKAAVSEVN